MTEFEVREILRDEACRPTTGYGLANGAMSRILRRGLGFRDQFGEEEASPKGGLAWFA